MKGFRRTIGKPTPKQGYSIQYTTDYYGNQYHRYMPTIRIHKDTGVKDLMNHKATFHRMLRLFIVTMILLGLLYWALMPKEYINPVAKHHNSRLNPVTFNEFQPIYTGVEPVQAKEVKKDVTKSEIEQKILNVFGEYGDEMLICMQTENGSLNPKALPNWNKNGTRDFGLMRINSVHCARHGLTQGDECKDFFENIDTNLAEGKRIFEARKYGFSAWYAPSCKQFHSLVTK